jgi:hypothetical protein
LHRYYSFAEYIKIKIKLLSCEFKKKKSLPNSPTISYYKVEKITSVLLNFRQTFSILLYIGVKKEEIRSRLGLIIISRKKEADVRFWVLDIRTPHSVHTLHSIIFS